jgi:hypothetical protein
MSLKICGFAIFRLKKIFCLFIAIVFLNYDNKFQLTHKLTSSPPGDILPQKGSAVDICDGVYTTSSMDLHLAYFIKLACATLHPIRFSLNLTVNLYLDVWWTRRTGPPARPAGSGSASWSACPSQDPGNSNNIILLYSLV